MCGAVLLTTLRQDARKCPPQSACWQRRRRQSSDKFKAAHPELQREYFRRYAAARRAAAPQGASAIARVALVAIGARAVKARRAICLADASRAIVRNPQTSDKAKAYARERLPHADKRVTAAIVARDDLIDRTVKDVRAARRAAWDALGDDDRLTAGDA